MTPENSEQIIILLDQINGSLVWITGLLLGLVLGILIFVAYVTILVTRSGLSLAITRQETEEIEVMKPRVIHARVVR